MMTEQMRQGADGDVGRTLTAGREVCCSGTKRKGDEGNRQTDQQQDQQGGGGLSAPFSSSREPFLPNLKYVCELHATSGSGSLVSLPGCWASLQTDTPRSPGGCRNLDVGATVATSHWKLQQVLGSAFHCHRLESCTKFSQVSKS